MAKGSRVEYEDIVAPGILERIKKELQEAAKAIASFSAGKGGGKALEGTAEAINDVAEATKDLLDVQKVQLRLDKEINELTEHQNKLRKTGRDLTEKQAARLTELKVVREQNTRELKTEAKLLNSISGSMNQLSQRLAKNKLEYRKLNKEERENNKIGGKLLKTIKKQDAAIKKLDKTIGDNQRSVGDYGMATKGLTGIMGGFGTTINNVTNNFTQFTTGIKSAATAQVAAARGSGVMTIAMKILRGAIIATGIGALVIGIIALVTWFKNTAVGAEKLRKILVPLKAIIGTITSTLQKIGGALSKIFDQPLIDTINEVGEAISGVNDELREQTRLEERLADLHTIAWRFRVQNLERIRQLEAEAAEQRKIAMNDSEVSLSEQLKAIAKSKAALTEIRDIKEQQRAFEAEQLGIQIAQGDESEATLLKLAETNAQQGVIQKSFETQMITLVGRANTLLNKQASNIDGVTEAIRREIAALNDLKNAELREEKEADVVEDTVEDELEAAINYSKAFIKLQEKNTKEKEKAAKSQAEMDAWLIQQKRNDLAATAEIIGAGIALTKEGTAEYKILATAQALINTYLAASQAFVSAGNPILGAILAAATVVLGLLNVAKINEVPLAEGTESVEGGTPGKDSVNALLMPKERVVPVDINRKLMGIPNEQLPGLVNMALNQNKSNAELQILSQIAHQGNTTNKYLKGGLKWMDAQGAIHDVDGNITRYLN